VNDAAPAAPVPPAPAGPSTALALVLTSAAALVLGGVVVHRMGLGLWAAAPVQLFALLLPPAAWAWRAGRFREAFPLRRVGGGDIARATLLLGGASAVALGGALLLGLWLGESPAERALRGELGAYPPVYRLLLFAAVPAFCEEALFRGAVLRCLRPWGRWPACAFSATLFAALHLDLAKFLPVGLLGFALALAVWETGSLWPAVVGHGLHNALVLALAVGPQDPAGFLGVGQAVGLLAAGCAAASAGMVLFLRRTP